MISVEKDSADEMVLKFTNGDIEKFKEVIALYNFVDAQALIRFALSIMLITEEKTIKIKKDGMIINVEPADHSVKKEETNG